MSYLKQATSRAKAITPSDSKDITPAYCVEASGAGATVNDSAGVIDDVTLAGADVGFGYIVAPTVTISDGVGVGCILEAQLDSNGSISSITIVDGGSGYTAASCVVTISGGEFPTSQPCIIYVGGAGNVRVKTAGGDIVTFSGVTAGSILGGASPINVVRVYSTSTTATLMTALW